MTSADDLLARYKPPRATVRILLDGETFEAVKRLGAKIDAVAREEKRGGVDVSDPSSPLPQLRLEYSQLAERAEASKTAFTFEALPREVVDDIRRRHPVTEERWRRYREEAKGNVFAQAPTWDSEGAAPELLSRALVAIDGDKVSWDIPEAARLWGRLSDGQATELFDGMWSVQAATTAAPLSATVTGETGDFAPNSTTPPATESPSHSS